MEGNETLEKMESSIAHPIHYGGANNPYEAIKVIEAWGLNFNLGNVIKYIARNKRKSYPIQDLEKAVWYLNREISNRKEAQNGEFSN